MQQPKIDVSSLRHPKEDSRYALALIVCIPVLILFVITIFGTFGAILLAIGFLILFVWIALEIMRANLIGHSVKVYEKNFPEIYEMLLKVKQKLDFHKDIDIYIIEEGTVNAMLLKFFKTKYIILNSELAENIDTESGRKQVEFVIARFIGALVAKHSRLNFIRILIDTTEKLAFLNFFILPYERATQYTGDQIGLAVCQDLEVAVQAFSRMMIGNKLYSDINPSAILYQAQEVNGVFGFLARIFSTHPHMVHRYTNLLAFARSRFPALYEEYVSRNGEALRAQLELALRQGQVYYSVYQPASSQVPQVSS